MLQASCLVDPFQNRIFLTGAFNENFAGNQQLKVVIKFGNNPLGSRNAGRWGIFTENLFDGEYYTVDGEWQDESFFAKAGWIKSKVSFDVNQTYRPANLALEFQTEHDIPAGGSLSITIPKEMTFLDVSETSLASDYFT